MFELNSLIIGSRNNLEMDMIMCQVWVKIFRIRIENKMIPVNIYLRYVVWCEKNQLFGSHFNFGINY